VLEMTLQHAKTREQFGRPIGSFQAVQHQLADLWTDLQTAWLATYEAITFLDRGIPADPRVALARSWSCEAFVRACLTAHQIFAGVGFMWESDLHLWTRKAKELELFWGQPRGRASGTRTSSLTRRTQKTTCSSQSSSKRSLGRPRRPHRISSLCSPSKGARR